MLRWTDVKVPFLNLNYTSWMADLAGIKSLLRYTPAGQEMVMYILLFVRRIQSLKNKQTNKNFHTERKVLPGRNFSQYKDGGID